MVKVSVRKSSSHWQILKAKKKTKDARIVSQIDLLNQSASQAQWECWDDMPQNAC
jgi:hypothetical protein